jgi:hypothetical protein
MRSEIEAILALAALAAGCADRPGGGAEGKRETARMDQRTSGEDGVRDLPSSFGRSFATLDEYLGHLRQYAGPVDQPWYREIRPGVYEYVTTFRSDEGSEPRTFTREELMRKYGFTR